MKLFLAGIYTFFFYIDVFPVSLKHPSRNPARKRIYGFVNRFRRLTFDLASASERVYERRNFSSTGVEDFTREKRLSRLSLPHKIRINFFYYLA